MINAAKVVDEFGGALKRIQEQAIELARVTKEGVMNEWFVITRVSGAVALSTLSACDWRGPEMRGVPGAVLVRLFLRKQAGWLGQTTKDLISNSSGGAGLSFSGCHS